MVSRTANRCRVARPPAAGARQWRGARMRAVVGRSRAAAAVAALAAVVGGLQLADPPPADAAVGSLEPERRFGHSGEYDLSSPKTAQAFCPAGKRVVGGGAWIQDPSNPDNPFARVRLTRMQPLGFNFDVTAEAPDHASRAPWRLDAYAICANADALKSYQIVPGQSSSNSHSFKDAQARCPTSPRKTVAFGSGAAIYYANERYPGPARVGLQMVRTSGPLDIARATGHEASGGYGGNWSVVSWAICAEPAAGIHHQWTSVPERLPWHDGKYTCAGGGFVHGPGGGGGLVDGGPVFLRGIYPSSDLRSVQVGMTGSLPDGRVAVNPNCGI